MPCVLVALVNGRGVETMSVHLINRPSLATPMPMFGDVAPPNLPGFQCFPSTGDWLTAKGRNREWFVCDGGSHWILKQLCRGDAFSIPKAKRKRMLLGCGERGGIRHHNRTAPIMRDDVATIAFPK